MRPVHLKDFLHSDVKNTFDKVLKGKCDEIKM